jgi:O-antigen/teichoic acid export membrane protein
MWAGWILGKAMGRNSHQSKPGDRLTRLVLAIALLVLSPSVFAYLDPSTGSMVVSAIVGIFASIALAMKTYWYKIKKMFRRSDQTEAQPDAKTAHDSSSED